MGTLTQDRFGWWFGDKPVYSSVQLDSEIKAGAGERPRLEHLERQGKLMESHQRRQAIGRLAPDDPE